MIKEFKSFLTQSNALALAIGVIIGAAVGKVVSSLADDLLMPVIGLLLPAGSWREAKIVLKTAADGTQNAILYGHFLGTTIDLIVIAAVVFFIMKSLIRPEQKAPTKTCSQCCETIPEAAVKCRACTSAV